MVVIEANLPGRATGAKPRLLPPPAVNPSIALIAVYFGQLPAWIDDFIETCKYNPTVTWLLFSDASAPKNEACNVRVHRMSFAEFNNRVYQRLGIQTAVDWGYKVCDFRPSFGVLFGDYLETFDFWGHCDFDIIWGRLRTFLTDSLLSTYDVISADPGRLCGPFTIFRNSGHINNLFLRAPVSEIFRNLSNHNFDEQGFDKIIKAAAATAELRLLLTVGHESEGRYRDNWPGERGCTWDAGRVFSLTTRSEIMFFHFIRSKRWPWATTWQAG